MTKVRTIKETIKELRAIDPGCQLTEWPGCQLTEWQLRQLVKEEKIPAMMAGKKALLSVEAVERYLEEQLGGERLS